MRLFLAIKIPEEVKMYLSEISKDLSAFKGIKRVYSENIHLTLLFIGESQNPEDIAKKVSKIKFKKFSLKTSSFGYFPSHDKIKVIWQGLEDSMDLFNLQKEISSTLNSQDGYISHITFARVNRIFPFERKKIIEILESKVTKVFSFEVTNFQLYSSELTDVGPIYRIIQTFKASK